MPESLQFKSRVASLFWAWVPACAGTTAAFPAVIRKRNCVTRIRPLTLRRRDPSHPPPSAFDPAQRFAVAASAVPDRAAGARGVGRDA